MRHSDGSRRDADGYRDSGHVRPYRRGLFQLTVERCTRMRPVSSTLAALATLAAGVVVLGGAGTASADVTVTFPEAVSHTVVFGDWLQIAGDDVFNAGHDNIVGSNN
ncbi:hypothetical protein SUDANB120_00443 [Streptomyces sp. enrichment culture]